jgi:hypothetical protein
MANELSFVELVTLGFELCGSYRLEINGHSERGFRDDLPLTSVAQMRSYIAKASKIKGRKKALSALRYVADNSASPMETVLTMFLTLPYRLGGYGFALPSLNHPIYITNKVDRIGKATHKPSFYCDLYWEDKLVDVEYDSDFYHTASERIAKDAMRRNALATEGITVITVSKLQIMSVNKLREVAQTLSKLLGRRLQYSSREFVVSHAKLRKQLLPLAPTCG